MKLMLGLLAYLAIIGLSPSAHADPQPGDFEHIDYICRCGCADYELSPIGVRVPGGMGTEYVHTPLWNPADARYGADYPIGGIGSADQCHALNNSQCSGYFSYDDLKAGVRLLPGYLYNCRWTFNPYGK